MELALDYGAVAPVGLEAALATAVAAGFAGLTLPDTLLQEPAARNRGGRLASDLVGQGLSLAALELVLPWEDPVAAAAALEAAAGAISLTRALHAFGVARPLVLARPAARGTAVLDTVAQAVRAAQLTLIVDLPGLDPDQAAEAAARLGPGVGVAAQPERWLAADLAPLAGTPLLAWAPAADVGAGPGLAWLRVLHTLGYDGALVVAPGAEAEKGHAWARGLLETARRRGFAR